jgi:hypothetical protein
MEGGIGAPGFDPIRLLQRDSEPGSSLDGLRMSGREAKPAVQRDSEPGSPFGRLRVSA